MGKKILGMVSLGSGSGLFWQGLVNTSNLAKTVTLASIGFLFIAVGAWLIIGMSFKSSTTKQTHAQPE